MRMILVVVNVVVLAAGLVLLVAGGVFYTNSKFNFFPDLQLENYTGADLKSALIPVMVLGAVLLLIGLVGCVGACTGKTGFLNVYFVVVLVIVVLEIALAIFCFVKKDQVKTKVTDTATKVFEDYKNNWATITDNEKIAVNTMQSAVGCCGVVNGSVWWGYSGDMVPPGCCTGFDVKKYNDANPMPQTLAKDDAACGGTIYTDGCTEKVTSLLNEFGIIFLIILLAIVIFEMICMCGACYAKKNDMVA